MRNLLKTLFQVDGDCGQTLERRGRIYLTRRTRLDINRRVTTTTAGSNKFGEGDRLVRRKIVKVFEGSLLEIYLDTY